MQIRGAHSGAQCALRYMQVRTCRGGCVRQGRGCEGVDKYLYRQTKFILMHSRLFVLGSAPVRKYAIKVRTPMRGEGCRSMRPRR